MKKIILLLIMPFLLLGCNINNTPTSKVEELMTKYQSLDTQIEEEIENILSDEYLTLEQKNEYKKLIKEQYQNINYDVKEEIIDGDNATVTIEIKVTDFKDAINKAEEKYLNKDDYTIEEYNNDKIEELKKAKEKIKYTLDIELNKTNDGDWKVKNLTNVEKKKIQGMY